MGEARPNYKSDSEARLRERVKRLEQRDQERAREIMRCRAQVVAAEKALELETAARLAAERNAVGFHAQLLRERVRKL